MTEPPDGEASTSGTAGLPASTLSQEDVSLTEAQPGQEKKTSPTESTALDDLLVSLEIRDDEEEVEIIGEGLSTQEDSLKLLQLYKDRVLKNTSNKGLLLVRYTNAKTRLRRLKLDSERREEALQRLTR